ncbi:MAG: glycosyl hydrolase [Bacteroidales bacterium]|nr:glycosyl hydrolase [Bacteroidales bacterium]
MKKTILASVAISLSAYCMAQQPDMKFEAETASYTNCELADDARYSGGRALRFIAGNARAEFIVSVNHRDKYNIIVAGNGIGGEKVVNCLINGNSNTFKINDYGEVTVGAFFLEQGVNRIVITPNWTWFAVDYLRVDGNTADIEFDISPAPVTQSATEAACRMYSFLYDNFGKRTVSGMMTGDMASADGNVLQHDDMRAVYDRSGKYPALVGFDFMNATGKSGESGWARDYTRKTIELAKDTYRRGGIPAFTWHWRDPGRNSDNFYTKDTDMRISHAMNADGSWDKSSTLYRNIISDIHTVADYLLELQREGMACIFRPLHEADGGWFWWGCEGGEICTRLYHLLYDEMVYVKGVRNVIWVLNSDISDPAWDPGEEYYDVISTDIYNSAFDYSSNSGAFDNLCRLTGGRKIVALAENGPVPDIDCLSDDEAMWSWWMPWYQTWNGNFADKTSREEWRKCMNDPRVITLDDMTPMWNASIDDVQVDRENPDDGCCYDLYGRKAEPRRGGIYVGRGRKIIVL